MVARGDVRHSAVPPGRRLRRTGTAAVALVLALAGVAHAFELGPRWLGWDHPSPLTEPAEVAPPPGLDLPRAQPAPPVAEATPAVAADPAAVRRAVARLLRDDDLGRRVALSVAQLHDRTSLLDEGPGLVMPASTTKLLTSVAALQALGPDHTFRTTTVAGGTAREVVLVGGGDPLLGSTPDGSAYPGRADLVTLGKATARALKRLGLLRVRVGYDTTLFSGPAVSPHWPASYLPDNVVTPVSPLWVDGGRVTPGLGYRSAEPALAAADELASVLRRQGIRVLGRPRPVTAPAGAAEYAGVRSAPLAQIVQWVLEVSDNESAEVLLRHVGLAEGGVGSFEAGTDAVRRVLDRLGVDTTGSVLRDGSGLSRQNRLAPGTLLDLLGVAADEAHPRLRPVVTSLPVAGFTGSLATRFVTDGAGQGRVRAKTGTLTGVHALAGVVTTADGAVLSFAVVADRVRLADTLDAREALDDIADALAACSCAA